jgi:hypothetical protein
MRTAARCVPGAAGQGIGAPVIFLTARDALTDRLTGFHAGGERGSSGASCPAPPRGERGDEALLVDVHVQRGVQRHRGRQLGLGDEMREHGVLLSGPLRGRGPSWWIR